MPQSLVDQLLEIGGGRFSRAQAQEALTVSEGNLDAAAQYLFSKQ